ncbi:macrophage colony-stimulating factor 1 receptor 2-like [Stegastes partitus]|uniref:receptor protein-tyrosine kinase n=1 Tax=Stegastes partitus TaxID=144197 RepID=A0A9Y4U3C4_9TELE|nr:PREDICTED: macrophage colony-stimulating factor 1 receptor 2-like [Stegastes partitus]
MISLNANFLPNQSDAVLVVGSAFNLSCRGDGSVYWSSSAFRLQFIDRLPDPVQVSTADPRHTGTYRCGYANHSLEHLYTWIHLYVTDPAHPSSVFITPRSSAPSLKEGQDYLFRCLLTDPSITNLTLQSEDRGRSLPPGMNVTFDPRRGALIQHLQRSFNGHYTCSGWKDGKQFRSTPVNLLVVPRLRHPPSLSVSQDEFVRLRGELFEVTCLSSNPSHFYSVTWTHPRIQKLNVTMRRQYSNSHMHINSTLSVSAVRRTHSGLYTCTAVNEAGVTMATTQLRVLDRPYLRVYLLPVQHANANTRTAQVSRDRFTNITRSSLDANGELMANVCTEGTHVNGTSSFNISSSTRVEAYEGRDVMLTFVMEAYPPIRSQRWTTPKPITNDNTTVYQESYTTNGYRSEATLLLRRVRQEDRGRYSFHFANSFFNDSQHIDLRIYRSPTVAITLENNTLTCSSSGYPLPTILWLTCPGVRNTCVDVSTYQEAPVDVTSQEDEEVRTHLPVSADDDVTVECVAYNLVGESCVVFNPRLAGPRTVFTPALIGALSAIAVLFLLLLVIFYKCRQKPKYEIRWKIIESTDGNNYTFVDPTQLPYNQQWEFPRDKLRLGAVLGSGAFGKVVEATAYGLETDNKVTRVAVKMLKPSAHSEEREALMSELKILSHLGYHDNIVNLLGACTQGGPMLMITEYCSHGDLLNFLRAHAQDIMASMLSVDKVEDEAFYKNVAAQNARLRSDSGISCCSEYQEMQPVLSAGQTHLGAHTDSLSVGDLMRFSYQVAQAPESIFQCVYTLQSDVWSYGVLLWEIFSLGKSPYPNVAVDTNFYKMIKDGRHMQRPDFAPAEMYRLMTLCWSPEPTDRPTFKTIGQLISRLLPSNKEAPSHDGEQATYRNIDECTEEEEDEVGGETLKSREEEEERHDDEGAGPTTKNIYQLS